MSGAKEIGKIENYIDIEKLYDQKYVLELSPMAELAVKQFLLEHECENIGGVLAFDDQPTTDDLKRMIDVYSAENVDNTFYGPQILNNRYFKNGIGVWTSGNIGPIR